MQETQVWSLGGEDPLEEETATHSSILVWTIPWTEDPGGLQARGVTKSWTQPSDFTFISDTPYNDDTYTNHKYINLYRKSMLIYILVYNKSHPYKRAPSWDCICKSRLFLSPVDSAACRATVCRATKSQTWPKWLGTHPNKVSLATWLTQAAVPYSPVTRV